MWREAFSIKSRRRPTFPPSCPGSIIGAGGLNFRVRDGNGCFPSAIATGNVMSLDSVAESGLVSSHHYKIPDLGKLLFPKHFSRDQVIQFPVWTASDDLLCELRCHPWESSQFVKLCGIEINLARHCCGLFG